jgi:hypothetical protein
MLQIIKIKLKKYAIKRKREHDKVGMFGVQASELFFSQK